MRSSREAWTVVWPRRGGSKLWKGGEIGAKGGEKLLQRPKKTEYSLPSVAVVEKPVVSDSGWLIKK